MEDRGTLGWRRPVPGLRAIVRRIRLRLLASCCLAYSRDRARRSARNARLTRTKPWPAVWSTRLSERRRIKFLARVWTASVSIEDTQSRGGRPAGGPGQESLPSPQRKVMQSLTSRVKVRRARSQIAHPTLRLFWRTSNRSTRIHGGEIYQARVVVRENRHSVWPANDWGRPGRCRGVPEWPLPQLISAAASCRSPALP